MIQALKAGQLDYAQFCRSRRRTVRAPGLSVDSYPGSRVFFYINGPAPAAPRG